MEDRIAFESMRHGSHRVFESGVCCVGATRCFADHRDFRHPGPIEQHVFVFPTQPVWVDRTGEESFLADPNVVTFHAEGDDIRRRAWTERGDCCNWFVLEEEFLLPRLDERRAGDRRYADRTPFGIRYAHSSRSAYLVQAVLVQRLLEGEPVDALTVEETVLHLTDDVLSTALHQTGSADARGPQTRRRHEGLVAATKEWFAANYRKTVSLEEIAHELGSSPFHLHRVFRAHTGMSLHAYRNQLRLRTAVDHVLDGDRDLTGLALSLGYSSHSHFTDSFRRSFSVPPSALRGAHPERFP